MITTPLEPEMSYLKGIGATFDRCHREDMRNRSATDPERRAPRVTVEERRTRNIDDIARQLLQHDQEMDIQLDMYCGTSGCRVSVI